MADELQQQNNEQSPAYDTQPVPNLKERGSKHLNVPRGSQESTSGWLDRVEARAKELMEKEKLPQENAEWQAGMEEVVRLEQSGDARAAELERQVYERAGYAVEAVQKAGEPEAVVEQAKERLEVPAEKARGILGWFKEKISGFRKELSAQPLLKAEARYEPTIVPDSAAGVSSGEQPAQQEVTPQPESEAERKQREYREAKIANQTFLERPLSEIYNELRNGTRHPRSKESFLHGVSLGDASFESEDEKFSTVALSEAEADFYIQLRNGFAQKIPEMPEGAILELQRAAIQLENDFYGEAAATIAALLEQEDVQAIKKAVRALEQSRDYLEGREKERDLVHVTEKLSNELYDKIGVESPERREAIEQRRREEFLMRYGETRSWRAIKMVGEGQKSVFKSEEEMLGDMKACVVEIGPPKFDEGGNLIDPEGNIVLGIKKNEAGVIVDEQGRVIPGFTEGETIQAIAKSTFSDFQFRSLIPPDATDANEWLAGYEATALESDVVPPTILRQTKNGRMSFQKAVQAGKNRLAIAAHPATLEKQGLRVDFENALTQQNKEEIALLQRLQLASDAGAPNIVLVPEGEKMTAYAIDNGLSNPAKAREIFMSAMFYERSKQDVSPETLAKLERYQKRLPDVANALQSVLRYDTSHVMAERRNVTENLLEKKRFEHYKWGTRLSLRDSVESEVVNDKGEKTTKKVSRLIQAYPDRTKPAGETVIT